MAAAQGNLADLQVDSLKIDDFQLQLSDMKRDGYTHNELLSWLQEKGIRTSDKTLRTPAANLGSFKASRY
jgi:hypothetical protein